MVILSQIIRWSIVPGTKAIPVCPPNPAVSGAFGLVALDGTSVLSAFSLGLLYPRLELTDHPKASLLLPDPWR